MSFPLVAIKNVAKVVTGKTPPKKDEDNFSGEISFITPSELGKSIYVHSSPQTLSEQGAKTIKLVPKNSVMVCCIGSLGKIAIAGKELATNQQINTVIFNENRVYYKYGFYALSRLKPKMEALAPSTTIAIINKSNFEALEIPLPPLPEQQRIAAILDKADAIRRKRQQAIQLADEFLRSVFLEMFGDPVTNPKGWEEKELSDIALVRSGVTKGRNFEGKKTTTVPYMRVANVQDGYINLDDIQDIQVLESEVSKYRLQSGDLLLTEGGDPDKLGRGAIWQGRITDCIHQNHIFCVRSDADIVIPIFLSNQIGSARGKRYFLKVGKQTTGIASINKTVLCQYPVLIPPIELQREFARRVQKVEGLKAKLKVSQAQAEAQFNALSQRAFAGQL